MILSSYFYPFLSAALEKPAAKRNQIFPDALITLLTVNSADFQSKAGTNDYVTMLKNTNKSYFSIHIAL